jgi:hypothetical protein
MLSESSTFQMEQLFTSFLIYTGLNLRKASKCELT